MAGRQSVTTQEGEVVIGTATSAPSVFPDPNVAYSSPYAEQLARAAWELEQRESSPARSFRGPDWSDLPNYYCPLCNFATLDGNAAVMAHGTFAHPGVDLKEHISG